MRESYKDLTYGELLSKKEELTRRSREVRFDKIVGHLENPVELRMLRRRLSRVNTIIHEFKLRIRGAE